MLHRILLIISLLTATWMIMIYFVPVLSFAGLWEIPGTESVFLALAESYHCLIMPIIGLIAGVLAFLFKSKQEKMKWFHKLSIVALVLHVFFLGLWYLVNYISYID